MKLQYEVNTDAVFKIYRALPRYIVSQESGESSIDSTHQSCYSFSSRCSMDQPWTEDSVARTLINPNYCLTDPPVVTEEKWIEANARLVQKDGRAKSYLATLLSVLRAGSK